MVKTFFIGQSFLSRPIGSTWFDYYIFYGANRITANMWQVNFSKERISHFSGNSFVSSPFCLNLEEGNSLRFPDNYIFVQKDGSVDIRCDYSDSKKGCLKVSSIKIADVGQDFLTVEYELAK